MKLMRWGERVVSHPHMPQEQEAEQSELARSAFVGLGKAGGCQNSLTSPLRTTKTGQGARLTTLSVTLCISQRTDLEPA
jgi:hypothetical protein